MTKAPPAPRARPRRVRQVDARRDVVAVEVHDEQFLSQRRRQSQRAPAERVPLDRRRPPAAQPHVADVARARGQSDADARVGRPQGNLGQKVGGDRGGGLADLGAFADGGDDAVDVERARAIHARARPEHEPAVA